MKTCLRLLLVLTALSLLAFSGFGGSGSKAAASGLNPCDPTPSQFRICQLQGGTFNLSTCRCEFP